MSSAHSQRAIQPAEFEMIERVLARAGYRGTTAEVDSQTTVAASRFLIEQFQRGLRSEKELLDALSHRGREGDDTPKQIEDKQIDRWQYEGGN